MQWTPARQAGYVHCLMAAILMALLENLKQSTALLGQRYVWVNCTVLHSNLRVILGRWILVIDQLQSNCYKINLLKKCLIDKNLHP